MLKSLISVLVCSALISTSYASPIKVIVMAGQSNMVGAGVVSDLPTALQRPQTDVRYSWQIGTNGINYSNGWENLRSISAHGTSFASEVTFGRSVADALTEDVAIIKIAFNGNGLERWWIPSRNERYVRLVDHVRKALDDLSQQGLTPELDALVWVQSQADASWEYAAARYEQNLDSLVGSFRQEFSLPNLTFIQNQHHANSSAPYGQLVRDAKDAFTTKSINNFLVNIDSHTLNKDLTHLSSAAQIELGYRLANTYLATIPEPGTFLVIAGLSGILLRSKHSHRSNL